MDRIKSWLRRKNNSIRFGVSFWLSRDIAIPEELRIGSEEVKIRYPDQHGIYADFSTIFLDDCYGLLDKKIEAESIHILDVGANIGLFSIAAASTYPEAKIHGYEPTPALEKYLQPHAEQAGFEYFLEAVGATDGLVTLKQESEFNLTRVDSNSEGSIPMVSLSTAVKRLGGRVDLLKLDCEGAEWEILEKADCWGAIQNIAMEYHLWAKEEATHRLIKSILESVGFEVTEHRYSQNADHGIIWGTKL